MEFIFVSRLNWLHAGGLELHTVQMCLGLSWVYYAAGEGMSSPYHWRLLAITDRAAWLEIHVKKESSEENPTCKAKLEEKTN